MDIVKVLAEEFHIRPSQVESTIELIDNGNTIPFIARYRKEATGGLTDVTLRDLAERLEYLRNLQERKEEVKRLIGEQGKLTEELSAEIDRAEVLQRVEDLYKPYRQKKATRAGKARARGLEPLAMILYAQQQTKGDPETVAQDFVNPEKEVASPADALHGACDIIAEMIADDADLTEVIRDKTFRFGKLVTEAMNPEEKSVYDMYYDSSEGIARIPNHRILAINRGEKEKMLKVRVETDTDRIIGLIEKQTIRNRRSIFVPLLEQTVTDAYKRLIAPSVEREVRKTLTERAEREAVRIFAKNTENLLMVPPVKDKRVISIDPGYRTGCKVAVLEQKRWWQVSSGRTVCRFSTPSSTRRVHRSIPPLSLRRRSIRIWTSRRAVQCHWAAGFRTLWQSW